MEYAEQTLGQILSRRALTSDEVRELLPPALDALTFLHRKNLVQGQVKPPNFLAVNDQLKLASDTIRLAGESAARPVKPSLYDPPEARNGRICAAGDIWGLGVTLVEALTQRPPAWPSVESESPSLPANLPPEFVDITRRCLSRDPANRPTSTDLEAQLMGPAHPSVVSVPQPAVPEAQDPTPPSTRPPDPAVPSRKSSDVRSFVVGIALLVILALAVSAGLRLFRSHPAPAQPALVPPASAPASSPAEAALPSPKPPVSVPPTVLHQEFPDLSRSTRESIRGHIIVTVRATVDRSGNVADATLQNAGSSKYFARLATAAARKWRFSSDSQDSREWLLRFDFSRGGVTGSATPRT